MLSTNSISLVIESLMAIDKHPLYVHLKQCFDKLKKYKFEIITTELSVDAIEDKFQSTSYFNKKKISVGKIIKLSRTGKVKARIKDLMFKVFYRALSINTS